MSEARWSRPRRLRLTYGNVSMRRLENVLWSVRNLGLSRDERGSHIGTLIGFARENAEAVAKRLFGPGVVVERVSSPWSRR